MEARIEWNEMEVVMEWNGGNTKMGAIEEIKEWRQWRKNRNGRNIGMEVAIQKWNEGSNSAMEWRQWRQQWKVAMEAATQQWRKLRLKQKQQWRGNRGGN